MQQLLSLFSHQYAIRALVSGVFIAVCASVLGIILVQKHYSLIGHGLSDVGFAAVSIALAFGFSPMAVATPVVVAASFIIMAYSQQKKISGDTALGIVATASMALGVIVTAAAKGFNSDVYNYMFGSILTIKNSDMYLSVLLAAAVIGIFVIFYNRIFLISCDEEFAASSGIKINAYRYLIALLTAATVVVGMKLMGTLLISSLIIMPTVSAKMISDSFKSLVFIASGISVAAFCAGIIISFMLNLPAGASIVAANVLVMLMITLIKRIKILNN